MDLLFSLSLSVTCFSYQIFYLLFQAKIWDISHCHLLHTLYGHTAAVFAVDMNFDGTLTITGSADRVCIIYIHPTLTLVQCLSWMGVTQTTPI